MHSRDRQSAPDARGSIVVASIAAVLFVIVFGRMIHLPRSEADPSSSPGTASFSSSLGTQFFTKGNILVTSPASGQTVGWSFTIQGQARVFESQFNYRIRGADGSILTEGTALAKSADAGQFGAFRIPVRLTPSAVKDGTIDLFAFSPRDGSQQDLVRIPVHFAP
ncbi:Gmad2 immunoglobulin-like domain-containing protein [Candidatus Peregrinibacteria bacterium]|nr:Gmad2 immunoglobulin-like domain-containing protein [Candidatus Peregrinibacteria bacterium]MBI3816216.1 Gmad2 immunoglobulin-like domain-containing protein [Candidatus Peregrinibacteria bacterium]